jgi:serine/threonine protein kinase
MAMWKAENSKRIVFLNGTPIDLNSLTKIGDGGEGTIYALNNQCAIKIFDYVDDLTQSKLFQLYLYYERIRTSDESTSIHKFATIPNGLITDKHCGSNDYVSNTIGYSMELLDSSYSDFSLLLDSNYCVSNGITSKRVAILFAHLYQLITYVHQARFFIGDLNPSNIMFKVSNDGKIDMKFLDVDSWGWYSSDDKVQPSSAIKESIKHPRYERLCQTHNERNQDWYAFCLLFLHALLKCDPFVLGSCAGMSPEERKMSGITCLHNRVEKTGIEKIDVSRFSNSSLISQLYINLIDAAGKPGINRNELEYKVDFRLILDFFKNLEICSVCGLEFYKDPFGCPRCRA